MKQNFVVILIIVAIAVGGIGFFGGMKYQQSKSGNTRQFGFNNGAGGRGFGGSGTFGAAGNRGNRPVTGQILSTDDQSITVKLADGSTKIVLLTNSTQINQATKATKDDLKTGITVAAFGTTNTDGSVTAQAVQINPQEMRSGPSPTGSK